MKSKLLFLLAITFTFFSGYSQVGINTQTPDASSVLDLTSTTGGFLPPRMGYTDMNAIVSPAEGLMVYCLDCDPKGLYVYDGSSFLSFTTGSVVAPPPIVISTTGKTWMDKNLGASRVAQSSTDHLAYGDLYQWGRAADGHQTIVWASSTASNGVEQSNVTSTLATTAVPNQGNAWDGKFILNTNSPFDWLSSRDDTLWQGVNGTNNPCPSGYRIPTEAEWEAERNSGAYASVLKLQRVGYRDNGNGSAAGAGSYGFYWSSTVSGTDARCLSFDSFGSGMASNGRVYGFSVRCIKD